MKIRSMDKPLHELLRDNLADLPPDTQARRIEASLRELVKEADFGIALERRDNVRELLLYNQEVIRQAWILLYKMSMEQWRQREAIKLYLHGQIDRGSLRNISDSWNGDGLLDTIRQGEDAIRQGPDGNDQRDRADDGPVPDQPT